MEKSYAHQCIGIEILPQALRAVVVEWKDKKIQINDTFDLPLKSSPPNEENVKPLYIEKTNANLKQAFKMI